MGIRSRGCETIDPPTISDHPWIHNPRCKAECSCLKIAHGGILRRLFISSERLAASGTLLTGRQALAIVFDYYGEDQRTTFLHGWEDLNDLRCRSDAELSHFWTTWQYLMLSMGEEVPEHLLLELLWTKDLRSLSDEWLYFKRVRDLSYEHPPDYSLKYLAQCIERKIRVDSVQHHRSEVQASLRSRGLALPAGVNDDGGASRGGH
eukprot:3400318-Amphidinium_carterae.2